MGSEKIRILRVIARLNIGGPAIHVGLVSKGLGEKGFETTLAAGTLAEGEGDMSYFVRSLGVQPVYIKSLKREPDPVADLGAFFQLLRLIMRVRPHVIHTHTAKAGTLGRAAGIVYNLFNPKKRAVLVHTFHGHVLHGYFSRLLSRIFVLIERLLARFTATLVVLSPLLRDELAKGYRIAPKERFSVVDLGFDLSPFIHCQSEPNGVLEDGEAPRGPRVVGIVGRLVPVKNHRLFLRSLALLRGRMGSARVRGLVVGDGELRAELEALAHRLNIAGETTFTGWRKDLSRIYGSLAVLALTSINEGTPVSAIEAMAAGVPVVARGVGGVPDLLGEERGLRPGISIRERGIMVQSADPETFSRALELVLDDEQLRAETVRRARDFVVERYDVKRLVEELGRLYLDLLENRGIRQ